MKLFKHVFNFYLDASIHVAFAVFTLVHVTVLTLKIPYDNHLAWFLFFGSICCYNFIKYGIEAEKYIKVANQYHKNIQIFSFIAAIFGTYHAYFLPWDIWHGLLILVFLTGLYALPVLPNSKNFRSLGGLKIFIVALVWAGSTVVLPYLSYGNSFPWDLWIETLQRFLFVLILLIPFEIRDLKYDHIGLKTLPQRYGVARTKIIGSFMILFFFFITFLKDNLTPLELIGKGILFLLLGSLMFLTKRNQSKYFASFWVEGIPAFWLALLIMLQLFFL